MDPCICWVTSFLDNAKECATGAGKTAIAEAAAMLCLGDGQRIIYTTPLKALSNQKLQEFQERFGANKVGLITGDISIQQNAPIVVMTTEILRNIMYSADEDSMGKKILLNLPPCLFCNK